MVVPRDEGPDPMLGHTLGNYRLLAVIGRGGMGHVYRAEHVKLGRQVALKLLRPEYAMRHDAVSRFFQEARAVNRIRHRNIVDINDFVELPEGRTFIIMELLEGSSLGTIQRRVGLLPRERAAHVLLQVCDALEAVHREGIVHRDLKPDNIFVISDPAELDGVRLLDFGVAKLLTYAPGEEVGWQTAAGSVVGTPAYMSPEQAGGVPVDHRSDIYSLGAIMYELFTGHPLFRATSFGEYVLKHLSDAPIPPRSLPKGQEISRRLEAVILRCLAKMPDQRYQNVGELRLELLAALQGLATEQDEHFADEVTDLEPITAANHGRVATDPMSSPFSHPGETLLEAPLGSGGAPGASSAVTGARWAPKTVALTSAIVLALAATASALWGLWGTPTQSAGDETPAAQRLPSPPAIKVAAPSTKGVTLHELPRRDLAEAQRTSPPQVTITIDSTPRGAIVVAEDRPDVVLGRTPWTSTFESDDGTHGFVVSAPGFVEEHTSVRFDRDGTVSLPLKPVTGATPAAVEGRPRAPATKGNGGSAGYRKSTKKRPSWGGAGGGDRRPGASRETLDPFAD
jgi:serine/threonine protein kinase